jgi:hypothetical protein
MCTAKGDASLNGSVCEDWYSLDEQSIRTLEDLAAVLVWEKDSGLMQLFDLKREEIIKRESLIREFATYGRRMQSAVSYGL